jgi:curved DNA-binding protein CbpA
MPDHFAILAQPRRPWLDAEALKDAFHRATAQEHPDVAGGSGENAAALNAAYAVLRDPATRLRHLLALEWPDFAASPASIPAALADFFGRIATLRQTGAALTKKEAAAQSPLARALLAGDRAAQHGDLQAALAELEAAEAAALADLRAIDAMWDQRETTTPALLAAAQQRFSFLAKWQAQLREDLFKLEA